MATKNLTQTWVALINPTLTAPTPATPLTNTKYYKRKIQNITSAKYKILQGQNKSITSAKKILQAQNKKKTSAKYKILQAQNTKYYKHKYKILE